MKKMSDEEFLTYWETRRSSKLRYVLVQGIIFWAFPVFLLVLLIGFISGATDTEVLLSTLPARILIWTIVGILFGLLMWSLNEKKYKQIINKKK